MPRLTARRHSLRCFILHIHNQIQLGKAGFAISFYVRVLTQASNDLCGSHCSSFVGCSFERGVPLTFFKHSVLDYNCLDIANVTFWNESRLKHPLRGSAMNQCNKLHLLYRLTSERIQQHSSIGVQPSSCLYKVLIRTRHICIDMLEISAKLNLPVCRVTRHLRH